MRKYLSLAVVALSSGGALVAAAGAANAATANDPVRDAPWLGSSPLAMHAAPFSHHDEADDNDAICGKQKADYLVGQIDVKLVQKGCITSGDMAGTPSVPGSPPVMAPPPMGPPESCGCAPHTPTPPVPPAPPVPCPPPTPTPCPPGEDHGWSGDHHGTPSVEHGSTGADRGSSGEEHGSTGADRGSSGEEHGSSGADRGGAPAEGNAIAGLPIVGGALGGLV